MIMYKLLPPDMFGNQNYVQRLSDFANIPMNSENTDYQDYLKWVAEGNTPQEAE